MPTLMIYQNPVAIDRAEHKDLRYKPQVNGFSYAAKTNSLPLATMEFGVACHDYPIVFITDDKQSGVPVALTGLRQDENLFIDEHGRWDEHYVPAFVRRYPFLLQGEDDAERFTVLIDAAADGINAQDGERLFGEDGNETEFLSKILSSLEQFSAYTRQTTEFVSQLIKLDLLIPRVVNVVTANGESLQLNGFSVVNEERLNNLNDAELLALTRSGHLASIYAHLISLSNIQKLLARLEKRMAS